MSNYIVQTSGMKIGNHVLRVSRAKMPGSCYGGSNYYRVAVIEVEEGVDSVSMISKRAKGVRKIVRTWERVYAGQSFPNGECAASRAYQEAVTIMRELDK